MNIEELRARVEVLESRLGLIAAASGGIGNAYILLNDPNTAGVVDPGINGVPTAAPATESVFRWMNTDSISDWLGWVVWPGGGPQLNHGVMAFGPDGVVAPSGALRFATPIGTRSVLMASRNQLNGDFQSIINVSSGPGGIVQSLEVGREFWEQTLLYGRTVILVCNSGVLGNDGAGWLFEQEGFSYQAAMVANQSTKSINWRWSMTDCAQAAVNTAQKAGKGTELLYQAGESTNADGGDFVARGGFNASGGATKRGGCKFQLHNGVTFPTMLEVVEPTAGQAIVALCAGVDLTAATLPSGAGDRVMYLAKAAIAPTVAPVSGFYVYVDPADDQLKAMGKNGTITPLALP